MKRARQIDRSTLTVWLCLLSAPCFGSDKSPRKDGVEIEGTPPIAFALKAAPTAELTNGRLSTAFTSTNDVLFQVNGLEPPSPAETEKHYQAGDFRLILMNVPGVEGALVSAEQEGTNSGVTLKRLKGDSQGWELQGRGTVALDGRRYRVVFYACFANWPSPRHLSAEP